MMHARSVRPHESQEKIKFQRHTRWHTYILSYTYLVELHVALLVYLQTNSLQPIPTKEKQAHNESSKLRYSHIYIPGYIYFSIQSYPTDIPTIKHLHMYMCATCKYSGNHNYSPLDQQLYGHALTTHTYLGTEAIDPYITTQADGIHTIDAVWTMK